MPSSAGWHDEPRVLHNRNMDARASFPFLVAGLLLACDTPLAPTAVITSGQQVELRVGESARLSDGSLEAKFEGVDQDSRCPVDVTCIRAGDAAVRFSAGRPGSATESVVLHTGPDGSPDRLTVNGVTLQLVRLDPVTRSTAPIDPANYRATVTMVR